MTKPTVVLVHGAWHNPECLSLLRSELESAGYKTVAPALPSSGSESKPFANFDPDVAVVRSVVRQAVDAGEDVLLFTHSYGGIVSSEAVKGLTKPEREEKGLTGGVSHMFYCCSFMVPVGKSLSTYFGREPPWYRYWDDRRILEPADPEETFYNDLGPEEQKKWAAVLKPMSSGCLTSEVTFAPWQTIPTTYLVCTKDNAVPAFLQEGMVDQARGLPHFRTETMDASHSPFLSMPRETAAAVRRAAGEKI